MTTVFKNRCKSSVSEGLYSKASQGGEGFLTMRVLAVAESFQQ